MYRRFIRDAEDANSEDGPGESRVASSMKQKQHWTVRTTAVDPECVQRSQGTVNKPKWTTKHNALMIHCGCMISVSLMHNH